MRDSMTRTEAIDYMKYLVSTRTFMTLNMAIQLHRKAGIPVPLQYSVRLARQMGMSGLRMELERHRYNKYSFDKGWRQCVEELRSVKRKM